MIEEIIDLEIFIGMTVLIGLTTLILTIVFWKDKPTRNTHLTLGSALIFASFGASLINKNHYYLLFLILILLITIQMIKNKSKYGNILGTPQKCSKN